MGGKRRLDESQRREVCAILSVGSSREVAARYVGCLLETIRHTADCDAAFGEALEKAESQHEIATLQRIQTAASKEQHWRAAAWVLERIYPDRYGTRRPRTITVQEIIEVLERFAELVAEQLPEVTSRRNLLATFETLLNEIKAESLPDLPRRKRPSPKGK